MGRFRQLRGTGPLPSQCRQSTPAAYAVTRKNHAMARVNPRPRLGWVGCAHLRAVAADVPLLAALVARPVATPERAAAAAERAAALGLAEVVEAVVRGAVAADVPRLAALVARPVSPAAAAAVACGKSRTVALR
jgi:hypothetical protein